MRVLWTFTAWQQYVQAQVAEPFNVRKINDFIEDIRRDPVGKGIGQTERLQGPLKGWSSRRITKGDRLVYRVRGSGEEQTIEILLCKGHY